MADNIVPIENHNPITSELKVSADGKGYVSFRGAARICGISQNALIKGDNLFGVKLAQKLVAAGFDKSCFESWKRSGIPQGAIGLIVEYYAFEAGERCTQKAIEAFRAMSSVGAPFLKPGKPSTKKAPESFVYAIGNIHYRVVKIGVSKTPEIRIKSIQTGSPYPVELLGAQPGGRSLEQHLHKKHASSKLQGEWFHLSPAIAADFAIAVMNDSE